MGSNFRPAERRSLWNGRGALGAAAAVFLIGLAISYPFMARLDALGVVDQYNILFDSDPNSSLAAISHGWGRNYKHWNLSTFFSIPIRIASKPAAALSGVDELEVRNKMGMLIVTLLSVLSGPVLLAACLEIGLPLASAVIVALVNQVCASRVIFGSVPDSFAISAFAIALFLWLAARDLQGAKANSRLAWILAGAFAFGVTVTNLVSFCSSWLLSRFDLRTELRPGLFSTAWMGTLAVAINVPILVAASYLYGDNVTHLVSRAGDDRAYGIHLLESLGEMPFALAYTVAGPTPAVVPEPIAMRENLPIKMMFRYGRTPERSPYSFAYLAFVGACTFLGAVGWYQAGGRQRRFGLLCLLLVVVNSAPHLFYRGLDLFLYSQHWQGPMVLLIGGICWLWPGRKRIAEIAMLAVLCVTAWRSCALVEFVLARLNQGGG